MVNDQSQPIIAAATLATDDCDYLYIRANAELAMAQRATHSAAASANYEVANAYFARVSGPAGSDDALGAAG